MKKELKNKGKIAMKSILLPFYGTIIDGINDKAIKRLKNPDSPIISRFGYDKLTFTFGKNPKEEIPN